MHDETSKDEKHCGAVDLLQNNRSVFQIAVVFIVLKTKSIYLVLMDLMAGQPAGCHVKIFKC